jgi:hypothetical protein
MDRTQINAQLIRLLAMVPHGLDAADPAPLPPTIDRFIRHADRAQLESLLIQTLAALAGGQHRTAMRRGSKPQTGGRHVAGLFP